MKLNITRMFIGSIWGVLMYSVLSTIGNPVPAQTVTVWGSLETVIVLIGVAILGVFTVAAIQN